LKKNTTLAIEPKFMKKAGVFLILSIIIAIYAKGRTLSNHNNRIAETENSNDSTQLENGYLVILNKEKTCILLKKGIDTIFFQNDGMSRYYLEDFDNDGWNDLSIEYYTSIPDIKELFLYDPKSKTYRQVNDMTSFPASRKLIDNYYFSYRRSGCADANWISDLFKIVDYKIVFLAEIYGQGWEADTRSEPQKIELFKVAKNTKDSLLLEKKLPYIDESQVYKWNFIQDYWQKNYKNYQ